MTFIKSYLDEEVIHEVMRQAIRETADEADRKDTFKDVYKDAYISVEDRGFIDEVIRDDDDKKQHAIFVSVPALLLIVAPISGCIMWFTSAPSGLISLSLLWLELWEEYFPALVSPVIP